MAVLEAAVPTSDHGANGRFVRGNRGGPGNPLGRRTAEMRQIIVDALTDDAVRKLAEALIERAHEGNVAAARLLLQYAIGRPGTAVEAEPFESDEPTRPQALQTRTSMPVEPTPPSVPTAIVCPPAERVAAPNAAQPERTTRASRKAMKRALRNVRRGRAPSANGSNGIGAKHPVAGAKPAPNGAAEPVRAS